MIFGDNIIQAMLNGYVKCTVEELFVVFTINCKLSC